MTTLPRTTLLLTLAACGAAPSGDDDTGAATTTTGDPSTTEPTTTEPTTTTATTGEPMRTHVPETNFKTVTANGLEFAYFESGAGPLVLLLHGFPDTAHTWDGLRPALVAAGYR